MLRGWMGSINSSTSLLERVVFSRGQQRWCFNISCSLIKSEVCAQSWGFAAWPCCVVFPAWRFVPGSHPLRMFSARLPLEQLGCLGRWNLPSSKQRSVAKLLREAAVQGNVFFPPVNAVWCLQRWKLPCSVVSPSPFPCSPSLQTVAVLALLRALLILQVFPLKELKLKVVLGLKQSIWGQKLIVPANSTWLLRQRFWICDGLFRS